MYKLINEFNGKLEFTDIEMSLIIRCLTNYLDQLKADIKTNEAEPTIKASFEKEYSDLKEVIDKLDF